MNFNGWEKKFIKKWGIDSAYSYSELADIFSAVLSGDLDEYLDDWERDGWESVLAELDSCPEDPDDMTDEEEELLEEEIKKIADDATANLISVYYIWLYYHRDAEFNCYWCLSPDKRYIRVFLVPLDGYDSIPLGNSSEAYDIEQYEYFVDEISLKDAADDFIEHCEEEDIFDYFTEEEADQALINSPAFRARLDATALPDDLKNNFAALQAILYWDADDIYDDPELTKAMWEGCMGEEGSDDFYKNYAEKVFYSYTDLQEEIIYDGISNDPQGHYSEYQLREDQINFIEIKNAKTRKDLVAAVLKTF